MTGDEAMQLLDIAAQWTDTSRRIIADIPTAAPQTAAILAGNAASLSICAEALRDHVTGCVEVDA